jgi:hypothetical protein
LQSASDGITPKKTESPFPLIGIESEKAGDGNAWIEKGMGVIVPL